MKYWASDPIDDLQIKIKVIIRILIIDLQIDTCLIWNISAESMTDLSLV